MGQTVILNAGNYGSLVGGKNYKLGGYGFNYPVIESIYSVTTDIGSNLLTASGGLLALLNGGNMELSNKPIYPFIATAQGVIYEIDYVIDDTTAMMKYACSASNYQSGEIYGILLTPDTAQLKHTYVSPINLNPAVGVVLYNKYSQIVIDLSIKMAEDFYSEPLSIEFSVTGQLSQMTLIY